jgi:hypothetical protein
MVMKRLTSGVTTTAAGYPAVTSSIVVLARKKLDAQRKATVPAVGLVNNFDPDQRGFLTSAMQGYVPYQAGSGAGTYGGLTVHADHGVAPGYQNPNTLNNVFPNKGAGEMRPQPGQPNLIYPSAAGLPNFNTSYIRGGKAEPYRPYPNYPVARNYHGEFGAGISIGTLIYYRDDVDYVSRFGASTNSPLPPGMRYGEITDLLYENTSGIPGGPTDPGQLISVADLAALYDTAIGDIDQLLPQDLDGRIRVNVKPLTGGLWALHPDILNDDTYWTGTTKDPLNWVDDFWYGNNNTVDKTGLTAYLAAHPGCQL